MSVHGHFGGKLMLYRGDGDADGIFHDELLIVKASDIVAANLTAIQ